jgi:hypothetical protein
LGGVADDDQLVVVAEQPERCLDALFEAARLCNGTMTETERATNGT